jgi:multidrug efflux system membrane fusion protein
MPWDWQGTRLTTQGQFPMLPRKIWGTASLFVLLLGVLAGCKKAPPATNGPSIPAVPVSNPVQRMVLDYVEYTGRIDARQSVGIKARATGFLDSIGKDKDGKLIREGSEVDKDTLLFQIDPRPYKAQLEQARSQVTVVEAQLKLAQITLGRAKDSFDKKVGSQQDVDQAKAGVDETDARLKAAKATVDTFQLNYDFTSVKAPITGQISRFLYTPGNLIVQDQTLLSTIVDVEQVFAYFDMDEPTLLKINAQVTAGRIKPPVGNTQVLLGLANETNFPRSGTLDFVNNVINPSTGTVSVRGIFENPKPENGPRLLKPGMFIRIRLPIGEEHPGLLVVDRAIGSDQGLKYVYVVDSQNRIQYRRVFLGPLQDDGLRVIEPYRPASAQQVESGLRPEELVVVGSLPQLRPQMEINPQKGEMPIPGGQPPPPQGGVPPSKLKK